MNGCLYVQIWDVIGMVFNKVFDVLDSMANNLVYLEGSMFKGISKCD